MTDRELRWSYLQKVAEELAGAEQSFGPFASAHEGYAVIKEEVDELWEAIKGNKDPLAYGNMMNEAKQVAAMAVRFMIDIHQGNAGKEIDQQSNKEGI